MPRSTAVSVDHSDGYAFLDKGTIYYSPNSSRAVSVPPYEPQRQRYPFHQRTDSVKTHMQPQWYNFVAGYLSFIPLVPVFDNFIFSCLKSSKIIEFDDVVGNPRWQLNAESCEQWHCLQDRLLLAAHRLRENYIGLPYMSPTPPSMIGFAKVYVTKRSAYSNILRARDWFIVWFAVLTFLLIQTGDKTQERLFAWLVDQKIEQAWVSGLLDFILGHCTTERKIPRVGTFIDPFSENKHQPTVEWLCNAGVPVWYRWGPEQEEELRLSVVSQHLQYLQPPVVLLQQATTHIVKIPTSSCSDQQSDGQESVDAMSQPTRSQSSPSSNTRPLHSAELLYQIRESHIKTRPWEGFFAARKAADEKYYKVETKQQRERRLNRERQPPRASAEVFLWDWSEDDPLHLVRTRVLKKERDDVLSNAKYAQKYDSVRNQWDVCRYFDFGTPPCGDDESDDEIDRMFEGMEPLGHPIDDEGVELAENLREQTEQAEQDVDLYITNRLRSYLSTLPTMKSAFEPQNEIVNESVTFDITCYLALHFGYTAPLPPPQASNVDTGRWKLLLKNTGLRTDRETDLLLSVYGESIMELLHGLLQSADGPPADLWDLNPSNRCSVVSRKLCEDIPEKSKGTFIVESRCFSTEPRFEWTIAVFNPADAVKVYRLLQQHSLTPFLLARQLLQDGIRFRTLLPLTSTPSSTLVSGALLPRRIRDHHFSLIDYQAYVQQRAKILASPRGRAALLQGGIVARLAQEHIDIDNAALGPSTAVTAHQIGYHFMSSDKSMYMDDYLTEEEIKLICGLYRCWTGNGAQEAFLSWWPVPQVWYTENNGHYWGHWTQIDEQWYQKRQARILEGLEQPRPSTFWRSALKGAKSWRVTVNRIERESAALYASESR